MKSSLDLPIFLFDSVNNFLVFINLKSMTNYQIFRAYHTCYNISTNNLDKKYLTIYKFIIIKLNNIFEKEAYKDYSDYLRFVYYLKYIRFNLY